MKTLAEHLIQYSHYHRVKQNILTHFAGIPLILIALLSLLSVPLWQLPLLTPALLLWLVSSVFYCLLDWRFGLTMLLLHGICLALAQQLAQLPTTAWLGWSSLLCSFFEVGYCSLLAIILKKGVNQLLSMTSQVC